MPINGGADKFKSGKRCRHGANVSFTFASHLTAFAQARAGPNAQQLCKTGKRSLFPHEEYCDYYYECVNGEAIVQTCPNGLAFAGQQKGLSNNCDYPHRVGCPDGARVMGRKY